MENSKPTSFSFVISQSTQIIFKIGDEIIGKDSFHVENCKLKVVEYGGTRVFTAGVLYDNKTVEIRHITLSNDVRVFIKPEKMELYFEFFNNHKLVIRKLTEEEQGVAKKIVYTNANYVLELVATE